LIVGRQDTLHLQSADACCVSGVSVKRQEGSELPASWKRTKVDELEVHVQLQDEPAGWVSLAVEKFGLHEADSIPLHTYAEAGRLDRFTVHAGDSEGVLQGTPDAGCDRLELLRRCGAIDHPEHRPERAVGAGPHPVRQPGQRDARLVQEQPGLLHFFGIGDDTARRRNAQSVLLHGEGGRGGDATRHGDRIAILARERSGDTGYEGEAAEGVTKDENRSQKG